MLTYILLAAAATAAIPAAPATTYTALPPQQVTTDVYLLPGSNQPGRGPDGNSVVFRTPDGLVLMDTGRHTWHSDGILAFAHAQEKPIVAIFNSHWHLDHTSGNRRIKAAYPNARVYASNAIDGALAGFLANSLKQAQEMIAKGSLNDVQQDEVNIFIDTMAHSESLKPDVVIGHTQTLTFGGRALDVHLAKNAATDGDVWVVDRAHGVAALGDLITLPAPYLDTACPAGWKAALDDVMAQRFTIAIPGHGRVLSHDEVGTYRTAFTNYISCVNTTSEASTCAANWTRDVTPLIKPEDAKYSTAMAEAYAGYLRKNGGVAPDCAVKPAAAH